MSEPTPHKAETPLTDAQVSDQGYETGNIWTERWMVDADFARTLERQLTQLTEERDRAAKQSAVWEKLAKERGEGEVLLITRLLDKDRRLAQQIERATASESRVKALEQACQPLVQRMKDAESLGRPSLVAIKYEKLAALEALLTPAPSQPNASSDTSHDTQ